MELLLALALSHFVADYPLQGQYLAEAKRAALRTFEGTWALVAHAAVQAGSAGVAAAVLGGPWAVVSLLVGVSHFAVDLGKVRNIIDYRADQALHLTVMAAVAVGVAAAA
jgi:hypothetical protein